MHSRYDDIFTRINEPPSWFDENGVPRYRKFAPTMLSNIYTNEGVLLEIACQGCGTRFKVGMSNGMRDDIRDHIAGKRVRSLAEKIADRSIHFGDPPCYGGPPLMACCESGLSSNSLPLKVIEYWRRDPSTEWERDSSLEVDIPRRY